jgi:hypothetical protein
MAHRFSVKWLKILAGYVLILPCLLLFCVKSQAISISQGYKTADKGLQTNMIAALGSESSDTNPIVERASESNRSKVVGIVTTLDASLLTLTSSEAKVHVATSGDALTYVADLNGSIKKGDFITISPISGVGMKASDTDTIIVGIALEAFNADTATPQQVSTTDGSGRTVLLNKIKVSVEPHDRGLDSAKDKPFLVLFGQSVTGKSVTQTQVMVALLIFFLLLVVEGSIIYGAVHSTIISIGRNPLARSALFKQLLQVSWLAMLVLIFGLGSIYAILWI